MITILNCNRKKFAEYIINNNKRMYFWGAGVMLHICMHKIISDFDLSEYVGGITDTDISKVGKMLNFMKRSCNVIDTNEFIKRVHRDNNAVIIITCSYFISIIDFLDSQPQLNNKECFILPLIFIENPISTSTVVSSKLIKKIPKTIHYCWFGDNKLPDKSEKCIASWKEKCPDYKIRLWNEKNIDFNMSPWVKKFADLKKWAFVSDYVRAYVLYEYGGLYFDTDVEILSGFDDLLCLEAFGGYEKWPVLNTGGGCGSIRKFWLWEDIMKLKDEILFDNDYLVPQASGYYDIILALSTKIACVNEKLYYYRYRASSTMRDISYIYDRFSALNYLVNSFKERNLYEEYSNILYRICTERAQGMLCQIEPILNKEFQNCTEIYTNFIKNNFPQYLCSEYQYKKAFRKHTYAVWGSYNSMIVAKMLMNIGTANYLAEHNCFSSLISVT